MEIVQCDKTRFINVLSIFSSIPDRLILWILLNNQKNTTITIKLSPATGLVVNCKMMLNAIKKESAISMYVGCLSVANLVYWLMNRRPIKMTIGVSYIM